MFVCRWGRYVLDLKPSDINVCLYHQGCPDGIAGAFAFWKCNVEDAIFPFQTYGTKKKSKFDVNWVVGRNVAIVDFCYNLETLKRICEVANNVVVLDHHMTNVKELVGCNISNLSFIFDTSRSGAEIAWKWCFPYETQPWFIDVIADRDLWKWEYENSNAIGKALYHGNWYNFEKLKKLYDENLTSKEIVSRFVKPGNALLEKERKMIVNCASKAKLMEFQGYTVYLAECNPQIRSEVGNFLAGKKECVFAATWRYNIDKDQWYVNLRSSRTCQIKLDEIAEKFGGGGHLHASAFAIHGKHSTEQGIARGTIRDFFEPLGKL